MFQNVEEKDININNNDEEEIVKDSNKIVLILKELFSIQNIIIYIITLLVSMQGLKNTVAPFGLAMVAACIGENIPIVGVFIMAIIGTWIRFGFGMTAKMVLMLVIFFALILLFKGKVAIEERNELFKTGGKLFAAYFIIVLIRKVFGSYSMYEFLMGTTSAALIYVFYKIFVNGLSFIKNIGYKTAFTSEELIAGCVLIAISLVTINSFSILSINVSIVAMFFICLVMGWYNGFIAGFINGIAMGMAITLISPYYFTLILVYGIVGLIGAALKKVGRFGVIAMVILGGLFVLPVFKSPEAALWFKHLLIAMIGLIIVPKTPIIDVESFFDKDRLISTTGDNRLPGDLPNEKEEGPTRLKNVSDMFNELLNRPTKEDMIDFETLVQDLLDSVEDIRENIFYDEVSNESNEIVRDIAKKLTENDIMVDKDLEEIFNNHNNFIVARDNKIKEDLQEVVKISNRTYKDYKFKKLKEESAKEKQEKIEKTIVEDDDEIQKTAIEFEIIEALKAENYKVKNAKINNSKNNREIIEIEYALNDLRAKDEQNLKNIEEIISKKLNNNITFIKERKDDDKRQYFQYYSTDDKYALKVGFSKLIKEGETSSSECNLQTRLADGKYIFAIVDGIGDSEKVKDYSKITLRVIKQIFINGYEGEETINLLKSKLDVLKKSEILAYINILILDLFEGKLVNIKSPNNYLYIKNNRKIRKITKDEESEEIEIINLDIAENDIIVMFSNGMKVSDKEDRILGLVKEIEASENAQNMSDSIANKEKEYNNGKVSEDVSIIVNKIVKK